MSRAFLGLRIAAGICALGLALLPAAAGAQTKPSRTEVGGEPPQSVMWVGNSFFYYNNSMHNHVRPRSSREWTPASATAPCR